VADAYAQKCVFASSTAAARDASYATFLQQNNQPVPNGAYPNSLQVGENIAAVLSMLLRLLLFQDLLWIWCCCSFVCHVTCFSYFNSFFLSISCIFFFFITCLPFFLSFSFVLVCLLSLFVSNLLTSSSSIGGDDSLGRACQ
jgi:hypothetical protein